MIFGYVRGLVTEVEVIRIIETVRVFFFVYVILVLRYEDSYEWNYRLSCNDKKENVKNEKTL